MESVVVVLAWGGFGNFGGAEGAQKRDPRKWFLSDRVQWVPLGTPQSRGFVGLGHIGRCRAKSGLVADPYGFSLFLFLHGRYLPALHAMDDK